MIGRALAAGSIICTFVAFAGCGPDYPRRECGADTVLSGETCVPAYPKAQCGAGTVEVQGKCVLDKNTGSCSPGTILKGNACVPVDIQDVSLPFAFGAKVTVSQGFDGGYTHNGQSRYAVDFPVKEGNSTVAAKGGIVWAVKQDSNTGCGTSACANQANYVIIDHGDATFATYAHLQLNGAKVKVGDQVCKGDPVGLTGNTGYSTGPHLHFEVGDLFAMSLPLSFSELNSTSGKPVAGPSFVSNNKAPAACTSQVKYSTCPSDLFEHRGVQLNPGVPCSVAKLDTSYTFTGKALVSAPKVMVAIYAPTIGSWAYKCATVKSDSTFSLDLTWSSSSFGKSTYMLFSVADDKCLAYEGWDAAVMLRLI